MVEKGNLALSEEVEVEDVQEIEVQTKSENEEIIEEYVPKKSILIFIYVCIKRIIDIIGALIGIVFLIPVTIIIFFVRLIRRENGPLFYEQLRYGKNGRVFRLFKFRTMVIGADKKLKEHLENNEDAREEFEKYQKLTDDPRITKLGNFLRKTSLDELPQMINILRGDMSFVGPRPVVDGEIERYGKDKAKFLSVKPGLTGYWQANGRSNTEYDERMRMELYYVDNMSLWLDIKIFFKTFAVVFKHEGAM